MKSLFPDPSLMKSLFPNPNPIHCLCDVCSNHGAIYHFLSIICFYIFLSLFFSHLYTQPGARTRIPKVKSGTFHRLSQPDAPVSTFLNSNLIYYGV